MAFLHFLLLCEIMLLLVTNSIAFPNSGSNKQTAIRFAGKIPHTLNDAAVTPFGSLEFDANPIVVVAKGGCAVVPDVP